MLELDGLPPGVGYEGLRFMKCFNDGAPLPHREATWWSSAAASRPSTVRAPRGACWGRTLGVGIMYRRGEGQMSANSEELHEMRQEGVRIETLVTPVAAKLRRRQAPGDHLPPQRAGRGGRRRQARHPADSRQRVRRALPDADLLHRPVAGHAHPARGRATGRRTPDDARPTVRGRRLFFRQCRRDQRHRRRQVGRRRNRRVPDGPPAAAAVRAGGPEPT